MMISLETQLDTIEIDLDDLRRLNLEEIEAAILKVFPEGLDEDELEALKQEILDELDELKDEWKDVLSGEKSELADADTAGSQAEHELNIEEIEDALATLSPFEDSLDLAVDEANEALDHEKLLNYETADNLSWTSAGLEESDEVTIKCTGIAAGSGSVWGDDAKNQELTDVNEDGVVTYADYEKQVLEATETDLSSVQSLTLGAAGEIYTLASVGDGTITFRVTDVKDQSFLLTIEGSPVIYFSPGVTSLEQVETWPETLTNRCYEVGDTMSFGNHLYANSLSDEDKLAYIETYEEVISDAYFPDDMPFSKDALKQVYQESLKILYTDINDPSAYSSVSDAWADVFQMWDSIGLDANDKRIVVESMILGVFQKGGEYFFKAFFQPVASVLQNMIFAGNEAIGTNSNSLDKAIQILLFTHTGATSTLWDTNFATWSEAATAEEAGRWQSGSWGNHEENIEALGLYQTLCANSGWALANAGATTAIENEKAMIEQDVADAEDEGDPMTKSIQISENELNTLIASGQNYREDYWFNNPAAKTAMDAIFTVMYDGKNHDGVAIGADELRNYIMSAVNDYEEPGYGDDMLSFLLYTLSKKQSGILKTLLEDSDFKDFVEEQLFDQFTPPACADLLINDGWIDNTYD